MHTGLAPLHAALPRQRARACNRALAARAVAAAARSRRRPAGPGRAARLPAAPRAHLIGFPTRPHPRPRPFPLQASDRPRDAPPAPGASERPARRHGAAAQGGHGRRAAGIAAAARRRRRRAARPGAAARPGGAAAGLRPAPRAPRGDPVGAPRDSKALRRRPPHAVLRVRGRRMHAGPRVAVPAQLRARAAARVWAGAVPRRRRARVYPRGDALSGVQEAGRQPAAVYIHKHGAAARRSAAAAAAMLAGGGGGGWGRRRRSGRPAGTGGRSRGCRRPPPPPPPHAPPRRALTAYKTPKYPNPQH
jgi:hypothetical protein